MRRTSGGRGTVCRVRTGQKQPLSERSAPSPGVQREVRLVPRGNCSRKMRGSRFSGAEVVATSC